jgi:hypothetical protein
VEAEVESRDGKSSVVLKAKTQVNESRWAC